MSGLKRGEERIFRICETDGRLAAWREVAGLVRCADCRHSDETPEGGMLACDKARRRVPRDGYCHLGERETYGK